MANERRTFSDTAVATTLVGSATDSVETLTIAASTGWSTGSGGDFFMSVTNATTSAVELIRCQSRTGTTITVKSGGRGYGSTAASAYSGGETVKHVYSAEYDADEANLAVYQLLSQATAVGQIPVVSAAAGYTMVQAKTSGQLLIGNGTTLASVAMSGDATINSSGVLALAADSVAAAEIATGAVGPTELASDAVITAKILDANVTAAKIAAAVAGDGLTGGAGSALAVNTDGSTIETSGDALRVKDAGITAAKLAAALPKGNLGYALVTSDQTGISTSGSTVDLTSVTVAATVGTSRLVRVTVHCPQILAGSSDAAATLLIREGSTTLQSEFFNFIPATGSAPMHAEILLTPTAASHTYKASLSASAAGGTMAMKASSTRPVFISVDDIGAA